MSETETTRRAVIAGAAGLTAATVLAACGDDAAETPSSNGAGSAPAATTGGAPAGNAGGALATKSEIAVGGGKIFADQDVVIVQPTDGIFRAYSATCTHQGCKVTSVASGSINCNCHNSVFSAADGSVTKGPATKALPKKEIKVEGDNISLA